MQLHFENGQVLVNLDLLLSGTQLGGLIEHLVSVIMCALAASPSCISLAPVVTTANVDGEFTTGCAES